MINNHRTPHEISTVKNDDDQHFNYRRPGALYLSLSTFPKNVCSIDAMLLVIILNYLLDY